VKTTQPRRYLVRPNQGLIPPGQSETVQVVLVEKDKSTLLQSYERMGQVALDHCKDKFLVQSCAVSDAFRQQYEQAGTGPGYESLTSMWAGVTGGQNNPVTNKKLHVRHIVQSDSQKAGGATAAGGGKASSSPHATTMPPKAGSLSVQQMEKLSPPQLLSELQNLRRKYDELVAFSVNLTAERDILNNTLEQTKRDLNREMSKSAASDNKNKGKKDENEKNKAAGAHSSSGAITSLLKLIVIATLMFLAGVRLEQTGKTEFLQQVPVVKAIVARPVNHEEL